MGPADRDLEDVGNLVRMISGQEVEQRPQLSGRGLEHADHLGRSLDGSLPQVGRLDGEPVDTRGESMGHRQVPNATGSGRIGEHTVDDPEDASGSPDLMGDGAHDAPGPAEVCVAPEKSSTFRVRSESRTSAARAGTAEMFRIR